MDQSQSCTRRYTHQQKQSDPGQRAALKFISLEPAMWLVFMLPLSLHWSFDGCKKPASLSQHKAGCWRYPITFLEPVPAQWQHLQYKCSWDTFDGIGGALGLYLLPHWTTGSGACFKCKEIALWGHFASISPFGSLPLCLQCLHTHWVWEHENNSSAKVWGHSPERGNTRVPAQTEALQQSGTASAGATSHLQPHHSRWHAYLKTTHHLRRTDTAFGVSMFPSSCSLPVTAAHVGDRYCLILPFPTQPLHGHPALSQRELLRALWPWPCAAAHSEAPVCSAEAARHLAAPSCLRSSSVTVFLCVWHLA